MWLAARHILGRVVDTTWRSLAYAEQFQAAEMVQQGIGKAMGGIESYFMGPNAQAQGAMYQMPMRPLAAQIEQQWQQPFELPSSVASVSQSVAPASAPPPPPSAPSSSSSPSTAPDSQVKDPVHLSGHMIGAHHVIHAQNNPIAPDHEKAHPDAAERIGQKYSVQASKAIGRLAKIQPKDDTGKDLKDRASKILSECVIAIQTGKAEEHHYHAIEQLKVATHLLEKVHQ